jgi:ATP-dependent Lon protease
MKRPSQQVAAIQMFDVDQAREKTAEALGIDPESDFGDDLKSSLDDFIATGLTGYLDLTSESRQRATVLRRLLKTPGAPMRPLIVADARMKQQIERLKDEMPHFAIVIDVILGKVAVSRRTGAGLAFTPLLIVAEPGVGKTHFARRIAEILRTHVEFIAGANTVEIKMNLSGLGPAWKNAREGQIARALMASPTASPLVVLDELDKVTASRHDGDPTDCLLALLEPENAKAFIDEYLEIPLRADHVLWLLTANDVTRLSAPLLDRVLVVPVFGPDRDATRRIAVAIYAKLNKAAGSPLASRLTDTVLDMLADETPRAIRKILDLAIGFAARDGRGRIAPQDLEAAERLVNRLAKPNPKKVGFVHAFETGNHE